jgi:anti-anti-sigma factor
MRTDPVPGDLSTSGLSCELIPLGDSIVVAVNGEVDIASAPVFAIALDRAVKAGQRVVVDCSGLTYFDSTGAHVLIAHRRHLPQIVLVGVGRAMQRLLDLLHLRSVFPTHERLDTLLEHGGS